MEIEISPKLDRQIIGTGWAERNRQGVQVHNFFVQLPKVTPFEIPVVGPNCLVAGKPGTWSQREKQGAETFVPQNVAAKQLCVAALLHSG